MAEFLIKREDGRFLELPPDVLAKLVPEGCERVEGWGTLRLHHKPTDAIIIISDEMPGLQIWFEGPTLVPEIANKIIAGIAERLKETGQDVYTVQIG
ncbi:MAG: hypothetical protein KDJ45_05330 [Hyphomicrobiaceae bacterium]|nr:hypothetical protein [Hyphomicrobiaceae bacterium]MCC0009181.1 hypothetical protein [Hyphomicrobiaceae bacterium]